MKTLELKDLKHYLGTDLIVLNEKHWIKSTMTIIGNGGRNASDSINSVMEGVFKPCFLPLSALTEQLPDGSIPIVELAKIATGLTEINTVRLEIKDDGIYLNFNEILVFAYITKSNSFGIYDFNASIYTVANQLQLFEYLYQNHFWLGDQRLFETGEIIDKITLK